MTSVEEIERRRFGAGPMREPVVPRRARAGSESRVPPPRWVEVIDRVCLKHRLHRKDVLGGWRTREATKCRMEIWVTLDATFGASLAEIGRRTGGYHHTSVLNALQLVRGKAESDDPKKRKYRNHHD